MTLLQQFVDSELIRGLTTGDKAMASLYVTVMGMSITFVALCVLWGSVSLLGAIFKSRRKKERVWPGIGEEDTEAITPPAGENKGGDGAIIAVLTAAVAWASDGPAAGFRVKSIRPVIDRTPQWGRVGRIEQLIQRT